MCLFFPCLSLDQLVLFCLWLTTGDPQYYNLHVQINNQTIISTLQREKGATIANTLVPTDGSWTPEQIRLALQANMKI